jgi:hypothetical protein
LWIASFADGTVHVVDELVQPERTVEQHLIDIESRRWGKVKTVACDPAGKGRSDQTAESNVMLLRRKGYRVLARASGILEGIEKIRAGLMTAAGEVRLFVDPCCVHLIAALQAYHYGDKGSEVPVKDGVHDHLIDALRYFYVNRGRGKVVGRCY